MRDYTDQELTAAVSSVMSGGFQLKEAARHYGVPYTTLQRRVSAGLEKGFIQLGRKTAIDFDFPTWSTSKSSMINSIPSFLQK